MNIPLKLYLRLLNALARKPSGLTSYYAGTPSKIEVRPAVKAVTINEKAEIGIPSFPHWELAEDNGNVWLRYWTGVGEYKDVPTPNILPGGILYENKVYVLTEKEIKS